MTDFLFRCKRFRLLLWVLLPCVAHADAPDVLEQVSQFAAATEKKSTPKPSAKTPAEDTYQINFNNVAITEYIRFVAKITGSNFVYSDAELQFTVTIVSEEPATPENIFSALTQVLTINGLNLLEQDGNYVITGSIVPKQIPEVVSSEALDAEMPKVPLVTRVFRIRNTNANSVATIIRTMLSTKALVSVSNETNQLIITDLTTNIDKISSLLAILDSPHSPLEIENYSAKHVPPADLIGLAQRILSPFTEGNPLIFVPQAETNSIFIVSTPFLIEQSMSVLADLDVLPQAEQLGAPTASENLFLYKIQYRSEKEILTSLDTLVGQLKTTPHPPTQLLSMVGTARYVKDSNSIVFIGDSTTFSKIQEILSSIDVTVDMSHKMTYYLYPIRNVSATQLMVAIHDFAGKLKSSSAADPRFISTMESAKYLSENNTLIFTGPPDVLSKVQSSLPMLDVVPDNAGQQFFVYKLTHDNLTQLENSLNDLVTTLRKSPTPDMPLIEVITSMKYVPDSNSFIFSGDSKTLGRLQQLLPSFDSADSFTSRSFTIYQPTAATQKQLTLALEQLGQNLKSAKVPDSQLIAAIDSMKFMPETQSFIFSGNQDTLNRLTQLLPSLDTAAAKKDSNSFFVYQIKNLSQEALQDALRSFAEKLSKMSDADPDLLSTIKSASYVKSTNSLYFTGTPASIERLHQILPTIDVATSASQANFFIYSPKNATPSDLQTAINNLVTNLQNAANPDSLLIDALKSGKYLKETNSFTFTGSSEAIARLQQILPSLDVVQTAQSSFYVYRIQNAQIQNLQQSLASFMKNLEAAPQPDQPLINAIKSQRFIQESNSIVFTGDKGALDRLASQMSNFDVQWAGTSPAGLPASDHFYIYTPHFLKGNDMMKSIQEMTNNLKSSGLADPSLIRTLETAKWVPSSSSVVFTGDAASIASLQTLLPTIDSPVGAGSLQIYLYRPINLTFEELEQSLSNLTAKLDPNNPSDNSLKDAVSTMQWVPTSQSIAFKAPDTTIQRLQQLLTSLDVPPEGGVKTQVYFLYKLQYAPANAVISYLNKIASNLGSSTAPHQNLIQVVKTIKVIPENNAVLLSGESSAVDQVKSLIAQYDLPSTTPSNNQPIFIYKPKYLTAKELQQALSTLLGDLSQSASIDPQLIQTVKSSKYVDATQSVAFSGSTSVIDQLKALIADLDTPDAAKHIIQHVGATTYFIYKLQYASAAQLSASLKSVISDLGKGGVEDKALAQAISNMKYIKETNSILFTGSDETLTKIQDLLPKFDIPALGPGAPPIEVAGTFVVYHPQYKPGDDLIQMLCDFDQNLRLSGITDPALTSTINNLRYMDSTCSLIITGDASAIAKVQDLLQHFDTPNPQQSMITQERKLGEMSFLIYKLQYHQGDDIRIALTRIAGDIQDTHKGQSIPLADAINAIQWISITNCLVTSGSPDILAKIRELIQNLDIPMRQVFIEVLILETSLTNSQTFGLSWSGRGQYRTKLAAQAGNFQTGTDPLISSGYGSVNNTTTPTTGSFVTNQGLDLGAIGDIILHKGQSFISIGSFLTAVQTDFDLNVVTNPKFIAQDSNAATVFFGSNIPFQGSLVTNSANSITTSSSLEYRNVGNNISITPTLGSGDIITLDISVNLSANTTTSRRLNCCGYYY